MTASERRQRAAMVAPQYYIITVNYSHSAPRIITPHDYIREKTERERAAMVAPPYYIITVHYSHSVP